MLVVCLLGIALAMDAFTVSIANGLVYKNFNPKLALGSSLYFGIMQGIMPLIGYFLSGLFLELIERWSGVAAFVILALIGGKMMYEGLRESGRTKASNTTRTTQATIEAPKISVGKVVMQGVATSIDALAAGLGIAVIGVNIYVSVGVIATITFAICLVGVVLGYKFGKIFEGREYIADIIGGAILLVLAISFFVR